MILIVTAMMLYVLPTQLAKLLIPVLSLARVQHRGSQPSRFGSLEPRVGVIGKSCMARFGALQEQNRRE